jgi:hypothetical protein
MELDKSRSNFICLRELTLGKYSYSPLFRSSNNNTSDKYPLGANPATLLVEILFASLLMVVCQDFIPGIAFTVSQHMVSFRQSPPDGIESSDFFVKVPPKKTDRHTIYVQLQQISFFDKVNS